MATWLNNDGLRVKFGADSVKTALVGEYTTDGPRRFLEVEISAGRLPAFSAGAITIADNYCRIPSGVIIEEVEVLVTTAFTSSGAATLNVGMVDTDGTSNADIDAFVAAATIAELTPLGLINDGVSPADGSGRGVKLTSPKLITLSVGTANYTAGVGTVRIYYSVPEKTADTLIQS